VAWREVLERYGWTGFPDIKRALDTKSAGIKDRVAECFGRLEAIARKEVA
jgi:hypothetical protein